MNQSIIYLLLVLVVSFSNTLAQQSETQADTVIINFGKGGSQMVFYLQDKDDVSQLEQIDFDKLMANVATYVDSAYFSESGYVEVNDNLARYKVKMPNASNNAISDFKLVRNPETFFSIQSSYDDDKKRTERYFNFELGLGGYFQDGKIPQNTDFETRPWGSRYIALNLMSRTRLSRQPKNAFYVKYGISFSWSNFMFDRNVQLVKTDGEIGFIDTGFNLVKSKLTVSYVNAPVMLQFYMKDKFKLSAGGYVGYRLGSYTKIKYEDEGDTKKEHERKNYNLSPLRYGVRTEIGWSWFTLFANYDLNTLFVEDSNTPELQAFSFGVRL